MTTGGTKATGGCHIVTIISYFARCPRCLCCLCCRPDICCRSLFVIAADGFFGVDNHREYELAGNGRVSGKQRKM